MHKYVLLHWQIGTKLVSLSFVLVLILICFQNETFAQSENPHDLVNAVNALRSSQGLKPYKIDSWLMAYAQEHSEYQASIQTSTHVHSDGTLPQSLGLQENVASGSTGFVSVAIVINDIWNDWGHKQTLIGYASGDIGAGIASSENGQLYYTVVVRPSGAAPSGPAPGITTQPGTSIAYTAIETSVPRDDGSIIHHVGYGQSLWSIADAYATTVEQIRRLNNMPDDFSLILPEQQLLIKPASTVSPTQTNETPPVLFQTEKPLPATPTDTLPPTDLVEPSPPINPEHNTAPSDDLQKEKVIGLIAILVIGLLGMLVAIILSFRDYQ